MGCKQYEYNLQTIIEKDGEKYLHEHYYGFRTDTLPRKDDCLSFYDTEGEYHVVRVSQILHPSQTAHLEGTSSLWEKSDETYMVRGTEVKLEDSIW
ncbi:hypothetical protein HN747_03830 [archaeon]|jgi:hypothetical protein|nr:hypothetical protein [archaeon]